MTVFAQQEIQIADEGSFCEVAQTFSARIPVRRIDFGIMSARGTDRALQSRLFETRPGYQMPRSGGAVEIEVAACGSQVDTATGALSATWLQKMMADGLGGGNLAQVGGVAGATATATSMPSHTATTVRGAIIRVGQALDGRANGQAAVVANPTTSVLTALPAAPNAGDVVRATQMVYPTENPTVTKRILLGFVTTGMQFVAHGCQLESATLNITHGDVPYWTLRYLYAYWQQVDGITIPSAVTLENCDAAVSAGGSYSLQTVGTTTRNVEAATEIEYTLNLGLQPIIGQGGAFGGLQSITGWVRTKPAQDEPAGTLRLVMPWADARAAKYDADGSDSLHEHMIATLSAGSGADAGEGRHVSIYTPRMYHIGSRPAFTDWNGLPYQTVMYGLREGTDETNDLTRSFFRVGMS